MPPVDKDQPSREERQSVIDWISNPTSRSLPTVVLTAPSSFFRNMAITLTTRNSSAERLIRHRILRHASGEKALTFFPAKAGLTNPSKASRTPTPTRRQKAASEIMPSAVKLEPARSRPFCSTLTPNSIGSFKTPAKPSKNQRRTTSSFTALSVPWVPFLTEVKEITKEQLEHPIRGVFQRFVGREPSVEELDKYRTFLEENIAESKDPASSLKTTLKAIYMSSRNDLPHGMGTRTGGQTRSTHARPKRAFLRLVLRSFRSRPFHGQRRNRSHRKCGIRRKTQNPPKMSVSFSQKFWAPNPIAPSAERPPTKPRASCAFFREYFGYAEATNVFKDAQRVREHGLWHDPRTLVNNADNLIKVIPAR